MLPVSSATTGCSCHCQIPIHGGLRSFPSNGKVFDLNCKNVDKSFGYFPNSTKRRSSRCFYSNYAGVIQESPYLSPNSLIFVDDSTETIGDDQINEFISTINENSNLGSNYTDPEFPLSVDGVQDLPTVSDSLSDPKPNVSEIFGQVNGSISDTINGGQDALNKSFDTFSSSLKNTLTDVNDALNSVINDVTSFINKSGESAGDKLSGISSGLKEGSGRAGFVALDVLRRTIVIVEDSLIKGAESIGYAYGSAKQLFPQEFQEALNSSEGNVTKVLSPVGTALQQVYVVLEGFEERLGLDPNDPLVPFVLVLGVSATLWGSYRVLKYSGYAGDLSPEATFELLRGKENAVLIDIRPENLRDRDGVPDLRRSARSRYASVTPLEVDGSVKKLLKGGRDIEDSLLAAVIRNLKIVEDRSKVLVMDADGTRSKSVARSLRKLGIKRPYQVQGGFRAWVKDGYRVKELKPETAITILNEEAEAILEEINPTPLKVIGFGAGFVAAAYSLLEWETTLQFIGVIGIGLTIFRRVASYQDSEDFKQDIRQLLLPVTLGGQAFSWAAGKLETNGNGLLPTSPSSSDIQSRVLQAAAKHESQPDTDEKQDFAANDEINVSEA